MQHSVINNGYIALGMHEMAIFILPVYYLTSPSCFSTLISHRTRKFRRFAYT